MTDTIYQEAINNKIQYHSEHVGRIKELSNREPVWSEPRKLFKKKHGKIRFEPFGVPHGTIGVYKMIYKPTGEIASIGCGVIGHRLSRHRTIFLRKGRAKICPGGTSNSSATGSHMYKHDTHRKNWLFNWCSISNRSLADEYEDVLIKTEKPLFNNKSMGGK